MDRVSFLLNGEPRSVGSEVSSDVSLLEYLRVHRELRGTKYMCREGGCGACVVAAARPGRATHAVNSCLVSVTSCQDWEISTIEGVGNRLKGYHPLQRTLARLNGTQCGYCSPGWVMAMYGLLQTKKKLTMKEIEKSLGSNICRCTGYRPILEAFKQFASDAPRPGISGIDLTDIEDLNICTKTGDTCRKSTCSEGDWCLVEAEDVNEPGHIEIKLKDGKSWTRVQFVSDIFEVLRRQGDDCYMLVAGNTAKGAYPIDEYPRVLIDISDVKELKGYHLDQNLVLGAGNTLSETMDIFQLLAATEDSFWYLDKLREHLTLVAHIPVRNLGTIAGNLMIKHQHDEFQSDVFLLLESIGAYLTVVDRYGGHTAMTPEAFLGTDMRGKVILNVLLPPLGHAYKFVSFKIMPRAQNAHAIVNAAFLYKLCAPRDRVCLARVVYGGLAPHFTHAIYTEKFLLGKELFSNDTLQGALRVLLQELVVEERPPEPSAGYRRDLALNLFYKGLLSLCPGNVVSPRVASGGAVLGRARPVSSARQVFTTNPALWPLNQPIQKVEALIQCAGEAPYTEDLPSLPREVFGAFVLARVPVGDIVSIDATDALRHPGVVAFYSAKDIPGVNSFTPGDNPFFLSQEELFCSGPVKYNGQVIGVLVAETRTGAEYAAKLVRVLYKNVKKPVIDVKMAKKDPKRTKMGQAVPATSKGTEVSKVIKGTETIYQQIHFCMETLVGVARPTEEGLEVHCTAQHMDGVQYMISRALNLPEHKIDVYVRRLGGAYGIKISRGNQVALASALVSLKLNRPCRLLLPLTTLGRAVGKRLPCSTDYEVAVDATGKIQYCNENLYMDNGYVVDEPLFLATLDVFNNCYEKARFDYKVFNVTTDTASNTWCRSPGTLEAIASAEFILERIAYELSLDPLEVRLRNLDPAYANLREQVERLKAESQYAERRAAVDKFNSQNRWKKRGLRFSLLRWQPFGGQYFDLTMSVYHDDGTVAITHGGIEMGQGLNTKAVQIAAYFLGISIDKIQIKGNNTIINPNGFISGGSLTSINIGIGVQRCCEELLTRLAPIRKDNPDATWEALVKAAFNADVDLQTHGFVRMADTQKVEVLGATLAEAEVDALTGEWELRRVDVLQDAGQSVSPEIDVGQVEGAFIMGLGYWTCEQTVLDGASGAVLTDRAWNYHVPQARDIPQDFRVYFQNKSYSEPRLLGAKSIGEPPICMSVAVPLALRAAVAAARRDAGLPHDQWFHIGAYPIDEYPRVLIDISDVKELKGYHLDQNLVLGAGNTLSETMDIFQLLAATEDSFWYLDKLREHLTLVAHIPVRNLGTIAGNLMIKHQHDEFQSDVFLLLESIGAYLTVVDRYGGHTAMTPEAFLGTDMRGKVILNVLLPPLGHAYKFVSFKIMPRAQNAHAIVNAAFLYKLCAPRDRVCLARVVYGGLAPHFTHAIYTEKFLLGKELFSNDTLQGALRVLLQELVVEERPPEPSAGYRRDLALNLFYKGLLSLCPGNVVSPRVASGGAVLGRARPVSSARQVFTTNPALWPLNQPIQKVEALIQCAGEAPYTEDLPSLPREVFGAFVLARVPVGDIVSIDATDALRHPGVVAFYSAKDIPGVNSFTPGDNPFFLSQEELFCSGPVKYNGQVIGVLVAETRTGAEYAAKLVRVLYKNVKKPVIDVKMAKKDPKRTKMGQAVPATSKGTEVSKVIKGTETIYQQIHFCMETLVGVARPTEEGLEVHCTAQHMDGVQYMISRALNLPEHKIDVYVRRLGGAYGIKISRGNQVALASALVSLKLNRPCRLLLPLTTLGRAVGKRLPCSTDYEVAVDATGKIQYCNENLYMDNGYVVDEPLFLATLDVFNNCYEKARFDYKVFNVTTDTASNTWCRSPGTLEAIASAEFILERIAYELSLDPLEVRLRNLDPAYANLREQVERLKAESQYAERRAAVDKFNSQNRWKKRGLRFSLLRWQPFGGQYFDLTMSVYHDDGTVAITHGGIEMGQGLNTKAVQIAAYFLGISIDKIQIKGNNTIINPNGFISGGSLTSINIGIGVQRCCEELLTRLAPIRKDNPDATWEALVKAAFNADVDLQTHGFVRMADTQKVEVLGATLAEAEVDALTGEWELRRVDVLQDAGQSVSPEIDVGQVEGAFIMGLGYWTCEQTVLDGASGAVLTDRAWNYHVPQARDIPQDFRVYFQNKSYSEPRLLGAKSIGEPPICMSVAVPLALRAAVAAARRDAGLPHDQWFHIEGPYTREALQQHTATKYSEFKFY